jgi:hypothetical protein
VILSDYIDDIAYDIAFWMAAFQNPDYPPAQLGEVCIDVSIKLRAVAIMVLLANGDSDSFFHNLIRSARCRITYLERLRDAKIQNDHHQPAGRVDPLLNAIAAGDFESARSIATLSPNRWMTGHEYEDDFCYAQILHGLITESVDLARLEPLFDRFARVLDGRQDARLDVTRVIAHRDQAEFEESFDALLRQRTRYIDQEKARNRIEDPMVIAERQVYVEGLAVLQIARRFGIATQAEYQYCPSVARVTMQRPFPGE